MNPSRCFQTQNKIISTYLKAKTSKSQTAMKLMVFCTQQLRQKTRSRSSCLMRKIFTFMRRSHKKSFPQKKALTLSLFKLLTESMFMLLLIKAQNSKEVKDFTFKT